MNVEYQVGNNDTEKQRQCFPFIRSSTVVHRMNIVICPMIVQFQMSNHIGRGDNFSLNLRLEFTLEFVQSWAIITLVKSLPILELKKCDCSNNWMVSSQFCWMCGCLVWRQGSE